MTDSEFIFLLKKKQGERSLRQFGAELGVCAAYLSDVFLGRRAAGPKILEPLGYKRVRTTTIVKGRK